MCVHGNNVTFSFMRASSGFINWWNLTKSSEVAGNVSTDIINGGGSLSRKHWELVVCFQISKVWSFVVASDIKQTHSIAIINLLIWYIDLCHAHTVPQFSSYSHMFPATVPDPMWGGSVVKEEDNILYRFHQPPLHFNLNRQHSFPPPESSSYARSYPEGKSFPFLQDHDAAAAGVGGERSLGLQTSCCQPLINTISFSGSNSNSNGSKFFSSHRHHQQQHQQQSRGLTQVRDSDCALSLLSSPTQTPSVDHHHIPVGQPLAQSLQQQFRGLISYPPRSQSSNNVSTTGFSCSGMENEHVVSNVLVSGATNDVTDLQCSGTFHPPSSSALPFSWPQ